MADGQAETVGAEMDERVSIVIPNWNGRDLLLACLASLERQSFMAFRTYVVDNGSQDGSVEAVRDRFPAVEILALPENRGFAEAMNRGFALGRGTYLVALNNDTTMEPDWLATLVAVLDARREIDFAASLLLCDDDRSVIDCVGDGYGWAGLSFKIGDHARHTGQYREPFEILSACAAAAIYRREVIEALGGYDPAFFAYMEDVDLSLRARLAGFRCFAIPAAVVYHVGSASTGGDTSAFSVRQTARNMIFILAKTIPAPLVVPMLPVVVAGQTALLIVCLTTRRFPGLRRNLRAYAQGLAAGLRGLPGMLARRRAVQAGRSVSVLAFARMLRLAAAQKRQASPQPTVWP